MVWLTVLILGFLQGVTEFLPVSSSAHLTAFGRLLGGGGGFELYVLANIGSLAALVHFSRHQLLEACRRCLGGSFGLVGRLIVGCLPAGLLGFFLADLFQALSSNLYLVAAMLMIGGLLMLPRPPAPRQPITDAASLAWSRVWIIGFAQALALVAGVSRSGATILSGLWLGLRQDLAVSWSFLLAVPLTAGAIVRVGLTAEAWQLVDSDLGLVIAINVVSFAVGLIAIRLLIGIIRRYRLYPFGLYRLALGLFLLGLLAADVL